MTLRELVALIREAIALEAQEGKALQEAKDRAEAKVIQLEAKVAELTTLLEGASAEAQAKAAEIADAASELKSVVEEIKQVNPSPVADTIVEAIQQEPEIETPPAIVDAPEVGTPEVTPAETGEAAMDAIEESLEQ